VSPGAQESADPGQQACAAVHEATQGPLRWFHDDYPAALACARQRSLPIVIDLWAPWCHTCLSMKHYVFTDPGLAPLAERFVWLAADTDKSQNAELLRRFPPAAWPTFYVISTDESVQARLVGAASLAQLRAFLDQGEAGHLDARSASGGLVADSPLARVRTGDRAAASGDYAAADVAYGAALAAAPADWSRRADVLVAQIAARYRSEAWARCAELGDAAMARTGHSASAADFAYYAVSCADHLEDRGAARALWEKAAVRLTPLLDDATAPLSVDDRSDAMRIQREIYERLDRNDAARALAERQRQLLDQAATAAPSPRAAMTFNWPRAEVYVYLGRGAELIPDLERSVAALPEEYDPPYRLAWVALKLGRHDLALANAERALALVYGPRKARAQWLVADIQQARGDRVAARTALRTVVEIYAALPPGQAQPAAEARARAALIELGE